MLYKQGKARSARIQARKQEAEAAKTAKQNIVHTSVQTKRIIDKIKQASFK